MQPTHHVLRTARFVLTVWVMIFLSSLQLVSAQEKVDANGIMTLDWIDLIPPAERNAIPPQRTTPIDHEKDTPPQNRYGGFRDDLDGQKVRMPGFVIPLEGDDKTVTELLLVPYFGACIHVPPPPPNQIVYVKFDKGAPLQGLWDVVYIVGTLRTQKVDSDLGQAGYLIEGVNVETYSEPRS